jgi:hypothetical protein
MKNIKWNPEPGTRNPEPGTWNLEPGTRNNKITNKSCNSQYFLPLLISFP